jgi:TRAP-type C4-dicarboxylate transport system substrate-binding protein
VDRSLFLGLVIGDDRDVGVERERGLALRAEIKRELVRAAVAKVFGDTINGLGGNAVPMAWGEVISAAKSGVIDGGDLPIVNQIALKIYEVSKYCSMTFHNYGPSVNVMNLEVWNGLTPAHQKLMLDTRSRSNQTVADTPSPWSHWVPAIT